MSTVDRVIERVDGVDNRYLGLAVIAVALLFPFTGASSYYLQVGIRIFFFVALVGSWNLIGYTGYINFGHAAFYGVGAYVLGFGISSMGLPVVVSVVLAGVISAIVGLALGFITLRLRGHYFAIASLMLLFILTVLFTNISAIIPGASMEIYLAGLDLPAYLFYLTFYYVYLAAALGMTLFAIWLETTKWGYGLKAIREDEDIAASLGVPNARLKTMALTASAFFAGVVGAIDAEFIRYIDATVYFSVTLTFIIVFMGYVGSMGEWYGPLFGVLLFIPADEALTYFVPAPELARIVYGLLFVAIILALPQGIGRYVVDSIRSRTSSGPTPEPSSSPDGRDVH